MMQIALCHEITYVETKLKTPSPTLLFPLFSHYVGMIKPLTDWKWEACIFASVPASKIPELFYLNIIKIFIVCNHLTEIINLIILNHKRKMKKSSFWYRVNACCKKTAIGVEGWQVPPPLRKKGKQLEFTPPRSQTNAWPPNPITPISKHTSNPTYIK